jgi:hypothetical protein
MMTQGKLGSTDGIFVLRRARGKFPEGQWAGEKPSITGGERASLRSLTFKPSGSIFVKTKQ